MWWKWQICQGMWQLILLEIELSYCFELNALGTEVFDHLCLALLSISTKTNPAQIFSQNQNYTTSSLPLILLPPLLSGQPDKIRKYFSIVFFHSLFYKLYVFSLRKTLESVQMYNN